VFAVPGDNGSQRRPAVIVGDVALDREALFSAAAAVARRVSGAPAVAINATASMETVVALVGCLAAGVPAVAIPPDAGPRERDHILRDAGPPLWLGDPGWVGQAGATGSTPPDRIPVDRVPVDIVPVDIRERADPPTVEPSDDSTALIMYTSGTTGAPKGAVLSRGSVKAGLDGLADAWAWTAQDVLVHGLPLFHVHGLVLGVLGALRTGSRLVHTIRPHPPRYAAAVSEHGGTLVFGVPTVWSRIAADPASARTLASARLLVSGSAALPATVARDVAALAGQIPVERYGMTETLITLAARYDAERRPGWVGTPISGVRSRVVDDAGLPVAADGETLGRLQVRGATLFDGYLNRPDATAASWTDDGWFRTGDIAAVDPAGRHRIVGRESADLIKSGGYRIGAGEIESALLEHPAVAETAVVGLPDPDLGQRIVAYVVSGDQAGRGTDAAELIDHVARVLSVHKRPREIRFVDELPRNAMGKVQKRLLTDQAT
jgi:fatty acid CoA ligase FadD36